MTTQTIHQRQKHSNTNLAIWTGVWLVTTALLAFGPKMIWDFSAFLSWTAVAVNLLSGLALIKANNAHLKSLDELGQRVFLEAGAITLGVLMVVGVAYELAHYAKIIEITPRISHLYFVMGITFIVSTILRHRKYS